MVTLTDRKQQHIGINFDNAKVPHPRSVYSPKLSLSPIRVFTHGNSVYNQCENAERTSLVKIFGLWSPVDSGRL